MHTEYLTEEAKECISKGYKVVDGSDCDMDLFTELLKPGFYLNIHGVLTFLFKSEIISSPNVMMKNVWVGREYRYIEVISKKKYSLTNPMVEANEHIAVPAQARWINDIECYIDDTLSSVDGIGEALAKHKPKK